MLSMPSHCQVLSRVASVVQYGQSMKTKGAVLADPETIILVSIEHFVYQIGRP
jgi:hypothetical protein